LGARREEEEGAREEGEGRGREQRWGVLILVQRAAVSILADAGEAAHQAAWPATRSTFRVLRKTTTRKTGWAAVGLRQKRKGGKGNWAAGPIRFKTLFFCKTLFSFVFSKPFANLVAILKLFENSNLLKIFKCLWNL
jgi:hypothetical protein